MTEVIREDEEGDVLIIDDVWECGGSLDLIGLGVQVLVGVLESSDLGLVELDGLVDRLDGLKLYVAAVVLLRDRLHVVSIIRI